GWSPPTGETIWAKFCPLCASPALVTTVSLPVPFASQPAMPDSNPGLASGITAEVCPSGFTTTTLTGPALVLAGVVKVILVLLSTATLVAAAPPKFTNAPIRKLAPVSVTVVPPAVEPIAGEIDVSVGGGFCPKESGLMIKTQADNSSARRSISSISGEVLFTVTNETGNLETWKPIDLGITVYGS